MCVLCWSVTVSLCARFQDGHWVSNLGWDVEVPAYSGGASWVGVVALGAPPPVPTLMQLARRSNLQKDLERVRLRGTQPPADSSRDLSSNTLQVANWSEAGKVPPAVLAGVVLLAVYKGVRITVAVRAVNEAGVGPTMTVSGAPT